MSEKYLSITTGVGRLVMGSPDRFSTKNSVGETLVYKSGARKGEPRKSYFVGIALPKSEPSTAELINSIKAHAASQDPQGVLNPDFAYKITDGDSTVLNQKNKRPCDKEGFPGHMILNFSSDRAPACYNSENKSIPADEIKTGYYVMLHGSVSATPRLVNPGVFLNVDMIQLVAFGEVISPRAVASDVFGTQVKLPEGAKVIPPVAAAVPHPVAENKYEVNGKIYTEAELLGFGWNSQQIASANPA